MRNRAIRAASLLALLGSGGCATYSIGISDSSRSGAEQLLLTGTADRAIGCINFQPICGETAYLDASHISAADSGWITFAIRREMARQGVLLVEEKKDARLLVEAAVGASGTDPVDKRFSLPTLGSLGLSPFGTSSNNSSSSPALCRRSRQDAVIKLGLVALDAKTHHLVWESGTVLGAEKLDRRFFGGKEVTRWSTLPDFQRYPRPALNQ